MADIRIKDLPTTASDFSSDDFIAIDGTANGTRKINAKTANLTFSDVTLGTSGPSVKSSLAARAARQGLVFDGTTGATVASVSAFGTGDFTFASWVNPTSLTAGQYLIGGALAAGSFNAAINATTGVLTAYNGTSYTPSPNQSVVVGKWQLVVYRRASGVLYVSVNAGAEGSVACTENFSTVTSEIGALDGTGFFKGQIIPLIFNRALSATEVVSLYESGVPSGADYNTASNTSLITGANSDFSSDTGYWTKVGTATIAGGVATIPNNTSNITRTGLFTVGKRYRIQLTISSVSGGGIFVFDGAIQATYTTNGTKTLEWTATGANLIIGASGSGNVDDVLLYPLGLLLAPDAAQAGGGLAWYDTSGNVANITLPASGVTWNVPTSGYFTAPTTTNLTLAGGSTGASLVLGQGTNGGGTLTIKGSGSIDLVNTGATAYPAWGFTNNVGQIGLIGTAGSGDASFGNSLYLLTRGAYPMIFGINSSLSSMRLTSTGNLLIGTTTDGGQKLQVNGTANFTGAVTTGSTLTVGANLEMPASSSIRFNSGTGLIYTGGYSYALSLQGSQLNLNTLSNAPITTGTGLATFAGAVTVNGANFLIGGGSGSQTNPNIAWTFSSQTGIFFPGGTAIGFTQGASETARFSGGNLGIGTASPAVRLNVSDSDNGSNGTIRLGGSSIYGTIKNEASSTGKLAFDSVGSGAAGGISLRVGGSQKLVIDNTGAATFAGGITTGADVSSVALYIPQSSAIRNNNTTSGGQIYFDTAQISFRDPSSSYASRLSIAATTGNITITSANPSGGAGSGALQVAGGIYAGAASVFGGAVSAAKVTSTVASGSVHQLAGTSAVAGIFQEWKTNTSSQRAYIGTADQVVSGGVIADFAIDATSGNLILSTAQTTRATISSTGATFAGAVAINNTVATAAGVASTHKVTMVIGGVTYYLLASNV